MKLYLYLLYFGAATIGVAAGAFAPAAFDRAVHHSLLAHPEVLTEMSARLQQHQRVEAGQRADAAIAANHARLFSDAKDPAVGNAASGVTVVEFFDFQCPYCKAEADSLGRLVREHPNLRIVFKQLPVVGGAGSMTAAKAALAAARQGKYQALHEALMKDRTREGGLDDQRIFAIAKAAGVDVERLKRDMADPAVMAKIKDDMDLAHAIGVTGTPAMVVGDHLISGLVPDQEMDRLIADQEMNQVNHPARPIAATGG